MKILLKYFGLGHTCTREMSSNHELKTRFSTMSNFMTLKINKPQTKHELWSALYKIEPRWSLLYAYRQCLISH